MNKYIDSRKKIFIYGAHNTAKIVYSFLNYSGVIERFNGFVVTSKKDNPNEIANYKVFELSEIKNPEKYIYIIAVPDKYVKEIRIYLESEGVSDIVEWDTIEAEKMIREKTREIFSRCRNSKLCLIDDPADETYMEMLDDDDRNVTFNRMKYKVLPYAIVPFYDENDQIIENFSFKKDYEKTFGPYIHINSLNANNNDETYRKEFCVYMICSHMDKIVEEKSGSSLLIPIQAGAALTDIRKCEICDNDGIENISERNKTMAEMTAIYWVWKNATRAKYIGICHYRRQFIIGKKEYNAILDNDIDVVLNVPRFVLPSVIGQFERGIGVDKKEKEIMLGIIKKKHPEYYNCAVEHMNQPLFYSCNMMIVKWNIFNDYCEFIFSILMEYDDYCRTQEDKKNIKFTAYWAEIITSIYYVYHREDYRTTVADFRLLTAGGEKN